MTDAEFLKWMEEEARDAAERFDALPENPLKDYHEDIAEELRKLADTCKRLFEEEL